MVLPVRYNTSDKRGQSLLRLALVDAWSGKCHWCSEPLLDSTFAEIDHIIPKSKFPEIRSMLQGSVQAIYTESHLESLRRLPDDPDDVSNLAPICGAGRRCNQKKLNSLNENSWGPILESLAKAATRAQSIERSVSERLAAQGLESHLISLLAIPLDATASALFRKYSALVLESMWNTHPDSFNDFSVRAELDLDVDLGEIPDYFADATASGSGVDGRIQLSMAERMAIHSSSVLFKIDALGLLSTEIANTIGEVDDEIIQSWLGDVTYPALEGPRWLSVSKQGFHGGDYPTFEVTLEMSATYGGGAVVEPDNNGEIVVEHRSVHVESTLICLVGLADGEVEHSQSWSPVGTDE